MLIAISVPPDNERGALYMEQLLDALHARNRGSRRVTLEMACHAGEVMLYCRMPRSLSQTVVRQIQASFPDSRCQILSDDALKPARRALLRRWRLALRPRLAPIRCWHEFIDREQRTFADPIAGILAMIDDEAIHLRVALQIRPVPACVQRWLLRRSQFDSRQNHKLTRRLFATTLTIHAWSQHAGRREVRTKLQDLAAAFGRFSTGAARLQRSWLPSWFLLSAPELATVWHPATVRVRTPKLATVGSRQLEPPVTIPTKEKEPGLAVLGRIAFQQRSDVFGTLRHPVSQATGRPALRSGRANLLATGVCALAAAATGGGGGSDSK